MMKPNDTVWEEADQRFVNPYSFVSLGGEVIRSSSLSEGTFTGKITCKLIVKSPLSVPDTSEMSVAANEHKTFPFFRVNGIPTIPGSQLKGLIRSAYETLSNSCLSVNNNNILSARNSFPRKPGLLQHTGGCWHLWKADMVKRKPYMKDIGEQIVRKWYPLGSKAESDKLTELLFSSTGTEIDCCNLNEAIERYKDNLEIYDKMNGKNNCYHHHFEKSELCTILKDDGRFNPVFYEIVTDQNNNQHVYLAPSQIGRSVFSKSVDTLLGTHCSCARTSEGYCAACQLFGITVSNDLKNKKSLASRLRFTDAELDGYLKVSLP